MNPKIYTGEVAHTRTAPVRHAFSYAFYCYGFDLDELPALAHSVPLFGYNRFRPVSLYDRDYLMPGADSIRQKLDRFLAGQGITEPIGRVWLVTAARYFNYVFNPVSFFYCYRGDGRLACIVTQVNNTFGDSHIYLLRKTKPPEDAGPWSFTEEKAFHVSPFFPRLGTYDFVFSPAGETIDITLKYRIEDELCLVARLTGRGRPLTTGNLAGTLLRHPLRASMTMPRILWQAGCLKWQRKLPVFPRPSPSSPMTIRVAPPSVPERIGRRIVLSFFDHLRDGELTINLPDGSCHVAGVGGTGSKEQIDVHDYRFFRKVMLSSDIGFGEAYTDGDWTSPNLPGVLTLLAANEEDLDDKSIATALVGRMANFVQHLLRPNTVRGSSRNIRSHYDLSNDFFSIFLDPTMTYSGGVFEEADDSLEQAQYNKIRRIIGKAGITASDHVLEIGCGWGGFALEAARRTGCRVTGITVSAQQWELARQRVRDAGLEDRVKIKLCDYRRIVGRYSKIVSIEMLEAVGHAGLRPFFRTVDAALEPGGRAVIQVITIADRKYRAYRTSSDWIRKHIFPGGHLPSLGAITDVMDKHTTLGIADMENLGAHYASTLSHWRRTFLAKKEAIMNLGFHESFIRMWDYYFAYCEAGFTTGMIDLPQIVLTRNND